MSQAFLTWQKNLTSEWLIGSCENLIKISMKQVFFKENSREGEAEGNNTIFAILCVLKLPDNKNEMKNAISYSNNVTTPYL